MTKTPVTRPPIGDSTPEALFTTVLEKEPVMGIELKKAPPMFDKPIEIISCEASTRLVPAYALAMVTCSMSANRGRTMSADTSCFKTVIKLNSTGTPSVVFPEKLNGGNWNAGKPGTT